MTRSAASPLPQDVVAALESGNEDKITIAEEVIRLMYAPVIDVHWVTVKQLAYLEPTLVEVVACMIGDLLNEALQETVRHGRRSRGGGRAMLFGHIQVALANGLRGDNPFSDACLIAMDYGREQDHQGRLEVDLRRRRARPRAEADAAPGQDPPLILLDAWLLRP